MKRFTVASAVVVVGLVVAPTVPGATATKGETAAKLRVIISEKGHVLPFPPAGTFVLGGTAGSDVGKTNVTPREVRSGVRDGESFKVVQGTNTLYGKKGNLTFRFSGVAIDVADGADIEYGTWSVNTPVATGMYEGWRGGGRWASSGSGPRYVVRWKGLITR
jgi:hypothetical protein